MSLEGTQANRFYPEKTCDVFYYKPYELQPTEEIQQKATNSYVSKSTTGKSSWLPKCSWPCLATRKMLAIEGDCITCKSSVRALEEERNATKLSKATYVMWRISLVAIIPASIVGVVCLLPIAFLIMAVVAITTNPSGGTLIGVSSVADVAVKGAIISAICLAIIVVACLPPATLKLIGFLCNMDYMSNKEVSVLANKILQLMINESTKDESFKKLLSAITMTDQNIKSILKDSETKKLITETIESYKKLYNIFIEISKSEKNIEDTATKSGGGVDWNHARVKPQEIKDQLETQKNIASEKFSGDINNLLYSLFSNIYKHSTLTEENSKAEMLDLFKSCIGDSNQNNLANFLVINVIRVILYQRECIITQFSVEEEAEIKKELEKGFKGLDIDSIPKQLQEKSEELVVDP